MTVRRQTKKVLEKDTVENREKKKIDLDIENMEWFQRKKRRNFQRKITKRWDVFRERRQKNEREIEKEEIEFPKKTKIRLQKKQKKKEKKMNRNSFR